VEELGLRPDGCETRSSVRRKAETNLGSAGLTACATTTRKTQSRHFEIYFSIDFNDLGI
jgi:hypothetical protein